MVETKTFKTAKDIVARKNQDGTVIIMRLDESSFFFKIDGIAADVWSHLAEARPVSQMKQDLIAKYPLRVEQVEKDMSHFLSQLLEKKLIFEC